MVWLELGATQACACCVLLSALYVGSFYCWRWSLQEREFFDRSALPTVKRRMLSVTLVSLVAPAVLLLFIDQSNQPAGPPPDPPTCTAAWGDNGPPLFAWLGLRFAALAQATCLPLLHVMALFLMPLVLRAMDFRKMRALQPGLGAGEILCELFDLQVGTEQGRWFIVRNLIAAPITEEWVFRACMVPMLFAAKLSASTIVFTCPLFFGMAHVHHIHYNMLIMKKSLQEALRNTIFQFVYTTVFGWYCVFIFVRTGHVVGCIAVHTFCNLMQFPQFHRIKGHEHQHILTASLLCGIIGFIVLFPVLLNCELYDSFYCAENACRRG